MSIYNLGLTVGQTRTVESILRLQQEFFNGRIDLNGLTKVLASFGGFQVDTSKAPLKDNVVYVTTSSSFKLDLGTLGINLLFGSIITKRGNQVCIVSGGFAFEPVSDYNSAYYRPCYDAVYVAENISGTAKSI